MKKIYRAVLVDDEEHVRRSLKFVLKQHPDIVVVAEAGNVPDALACIREEKPDLIFLDIKLPGQDGFELLEALSGDDVLEAEVIFLTAFNEFAIKAIKCSAFDYLLKPVDPAVLSETLDRFRNSVRPALSTRIHELEAQLPKMGNRIRFATQTGFVWFSAEQILYIEAEGSYCKVYSCDGASVLICRNLKSIEDRLEGYGFVRIHKSFLINAQYLVAYNKNRRMVSLGAAGIHCEVPVSFRMMRNLTF